MLIIHVGPGGVKEVQLQAATDFFEDLDLAVWPIIRKELDRLDKKPKRASKRALKLAEKVGT